MRNQKNRCSHKGTTIFIITSVLVLISLIGCGHIRTDTDTSPYNNIQNEEVLCTSTTTTIVTKNTVRITTGMTNISTTVVIWTMTNTGIATTQENGADLMIPTFYSTAVKTQPLITSEIIPNENHTELYTECTDSGNNYNGLPITEQEFILLGNLISHESGSSWISEYNRACIVNAVMNRVNDSRFPNTIDEVLHQQGQIFDVPYYEMNYSTLPRTEIENAIYAYFSGEYTFDNSNSWTGTGIENIFYYQ